MQLDTVVNDVLNQNSIKNNSTSTISSRNDYLSSNNDYKNDYKIDLDIPPFLRRNKNDN